MGERRSEVGPTLCSFQWKRSGPKPSGESRPVVGSAGQRQPSRRCQRLVRSGRFKNGRRLHFSLRRFALSTSIGQRLHLATWRVANSDSKVGAKGDLNFMPPPLAHGDLWRPLGATPATTPPRASRKVKMPQQIRTIFPSSPHHAISNSFATSSLLDLIRWRKWKLNKQLRAPIVTMSTHLATFQWRQCHSY